MRLKYCISLLLLLLFVSGCALGKKGWPEAEESQDAFSIKVISAERKDKCLMLVLNVTGAAEKLYRASIQYEQVGTVDGGCIECPFVPRSAYHITRELSDFVLENNTLTLSMCGLESGMEYRFRVAGKNELPAMPLVFTKVYVASP